MANALLDLLQAASNTVVDTVAGPVDLLTLAMQKMGSPVRDPVGGTEWFNRAGLRRDVQPGFAKAAGETFGLVAPMAAAAKAPQIASNLVKHGEQFQRYNQSAGPAGASLATVWHGSPHRMASTPRNPLGEFDSSKIGTGEGAQAYGMGHYLADVKDTAESYSNIALTVPSLTVNGRRLYLPNGLPDESALSALGIDDATRIALNLVHGDVSSPAFAELASNAGKQLFKTAKVEYIGPQIYKVDLPDNAIARMLDWDAPLSKQAPEVLAGLRKLAYDKKSPLKGDTAQQLAGLLESPASWNKGESLVRLFGHEQKDLSDVLREVGIPGIKYFDGVSRGAGQGTRNYVVFPGGEDLLTILERNGNPLEQLVK